MRYLAKRGLAGMVQIGLLSVIAFFLLNAAPGDFYSPAALELNASPQALETWRTEHGLNRSWPRRYLDWAASAARGEFGTSLAYGSPVAALVRPRLGNTLQIVIPSLVLCWMIGLGLALAAVRRGIKTARLLDSAAMFVSLLPDAIVVSLLLWLAVWMGTAVTLSLWLPVAALTVMLLPAVILHATQGLAQARTLEYVRLAEQRGVSHPLLWRNYILPAAANPLLSLAGLSLAGAIGSSLLVEVLLGWPGLGSLFLEAAQSRDYPIVTTVVTLLGSVLIASNVLADIALYWLDPRIRLRHESS